MLFLKLKLFLVALGLICASPAVLAQAQVARVLEAKGTALLERAGQLPRLLGAGETLNERDVVNVARDSWAIIEFNDQTRVTLRPNTVFRLDAYKADAPESMLLGLAKGGLRVVTGLLGKRNPQGVKVQTAVATIGIRGTEFDARLCAEDCASEEKAKPAPRPLLLPAARVVDMNGVVAAGRADEAVRLLVPGAMLNEGDAVAVGRGGSALLVFRDGSRVSLVENSRLAINRFRFNEAEPREGSAFLTLYAGNALVTTGQLAKISPDAFLFRTALGVVRPFGTTFGGGGCIGSLCASGSVTVNSDGASASGSASGGGASASGSASAGAGGASASGEVNKPGGGGASGRLNLGPNTDTTQMAKTPAAPVSVPIPYPNLPSAAAVNEAVNGVQQVVNEITGSAASQGRSAAGAARQRATETAAAGQDRLQTATQNAADAAAAQAVAALNKVTAPLVAEMTALMTQLRNNPPSTEAAAGDLAARAGQLSQQMGAALSAAVAGAGSIADAAVFKTAMGLQQLLHLEFMGTLAQSLYWSSSVNVMAGVGAGEYFFSQLQLVRNTPYLASSFDAIGISNADLDRALFWQTPDSVVEAVASSISPGRLLHAKGILEAESSEWMAAAGSAAGNALLAEARAASDAARQRSEREAAAARAAAEAAKAAADAKLAAARKAAEEKAAADQKIVEQKLAAAKAAAEAKSTQIEASGRSYDISGGVIAVVGPPDLVTSPGILQTLPGEPVVERSPDGKTVTTRWNETMVGTVRTLHGGTALSGNVQRTEIAGPEGSTTILVFNVIFADPSMTPGIPPVPSVGGPLVSLGPGRGIIQVTHRAPDGTTTTSYPANQNGSNNPSSVAVMEGEVEIVGRGRVREGEMLASSGSPVRVPGLTKTSLARAGGDPFGAAEKAVEEGLYVWVRDGAVQVAKDNQSVDVGAGNSAVATKDRVRLLDAVPNFLRFDSTPRPFPALGESKVDVFRAADGALLNMCSIR